MLATVLLLLVVLAVCSVPAVTASRLVHEQIEVFRRIVQEGFGHEELTLDGLVQLMHLMDGNPKYNKAALKRVVGMFGGEENFSFKRLEEIVNKIYGDQISDDPYQPQEVHLALTGNVEEMKVMWVTMQGLDKPVVEYLPATAEDWTQATSASAISYTYTVPQNWWPVFTGMIYEVDMKRLKPGNAYKYRVGGFDAANNTMRYSQEYTFKAAPLPGHPSRTSKAFALADHGTFMLFGFETVWKMKSLMDKYDPDMVFVAGDLSYAGLSSAMPRLNISKEDEFEHIWDLLGIQNEPVAARIPWMVGNGNHERFYNWTAYTNRYKMPNNADLGSDGNFWYTFTNGNMQWVQISSEHSLDPGSPQMNFIQKALDAANANRANVPWVIVALHKPLYCSIDGSPSFAAQLEDILKQYDVDMTITGHMHAYERIHPVLKGDVLLYPTKEFMLNHDTQKVSRADVYRGSDFGPVHVMQGFTGGMQAERFIQPQPAWSAFRMADGIIPPNLTRSDMSEVDWRARHKDLTFAVDFSDASETDVHLIADLPVLSDRARELSVDYNYSHTYGFGYITAINATHLHYQAIPNVDGIANHDEFWLIKEHKVKAFMV